MAPLTFLLLIVSVLGGSLLLGDAGEKTRLHLKENQERIEQAWLEEKVRECHAKGGVAQLDRGKYLGCNLPVGRIRTQLR